MARRGRLLLALTALLAATAVACTRDGENAADLTPTSTTTSEAPATSAATTSTTGAPAATATCQQSAVAGRSVHTMTSAGVERSYVLYVPVGPPRPRPVVVSIHGWGGNAAQQLDYTGIEAVSEREDFLVVAPNGAGTPPHFELIGTQDVDFIVAMIDDVANHACIDRDRVFATGMSNGGAMSSVLGCRAADTFAAVAPVAAIVYIEPFCANTAAIPVIAFMGTADTVVPFAGGRVNCCGEWYVRPASDAMHDWAVHNGCAVPPIIERVGTDVELRRWDGCRDGAATRFYVVEDGGHSWPGAVPIEGLGKTTTSVDATEEVWMFFEQLTAAAR